VINGVAAAAAPQGSAGVRRTMQGIIPSLVTNQFVPNQNGFPAGGGSGNILTETVLNAGLRLVWEQASSRIDTILCGGVQKRRINEFLSASRLYDAADVRYTSRVALYESDFGL